MAGEEEGTREVRFEHCEHVSYFWDPFRCAPPRTLFSSISQSRRLTMVEQRGFSFLGNMTRYWLDALCKFKRFHHWYISWRNITKDHIFLTTRIFFQDTLDIKLPQGYALVFQQKGMLHAGLGNLKHMSDIKHMSYIKFTLELGSFKHMSDIKYRCDIKHMSDIKFTLDMVVSYTYDWYQMAAYEITLPTDVAGPADACKYIAQVISNNIFFISPFKYLPPWLEFLIS